MSNLLDLCTANPTTQLGPCAEVRVGEHVTRYVRRGTGPSVVVVGADACTDGTADLVHELIASGMTVEVVEGSWRRPSRVRAARIPSDLE